MRQFRQFDLALVLSVITSASFAQSTTQSTTQNAPPARYLLSLSDTDMIGTAYVDGKLGAPEPLPDTLSVFDLRRPGGAAVGSVGAPNSNFSPPKVMAVAAQGRVALVVETLPARTASMTLLSELEATPGDRMRAFDISNPTAPRLLGEAKVNARPQAVTVNPAGDLAVVAGLTPAMGLNFVPVSAAGMGAVQTVPLPVPARADLGFEAVNLVSWHPSGRFIAVHLTFRSQIAFFEVIRSTEGAISLRPWGNTVLVNKFPLNGTFSPDGKHYFTSDLMWGTDVEGFFQVNTGLLTSIKIADPSSSGDAVKHFVSAVVAGGLNAETIAVSPDGKLLAALALRNTGRLKSEATYDPKAALRLYRINATSGELTLVGETMFEAALPQGLAFDPSGAFLYVGVNEYGNETGPLKGAVEVWRVRQGATPSLQRTDQRFRAPRGVHTLALIP
jgi:Lactonase, 7-bladed beta-propeller